MELDGSIDLVGPWRRGLALGLNEAAGYGGVALAAGLSGLLAGALVVLALSDGAIPVAAGAAALLGLGTALVYPTPGRSPPRRQRRSTGR